MIDFTIKFSEQSISSQRKISRLSKRSSETENGMVKFGRQCQIMRLNKAQEINLCEIKCRHLVNDMMICNSLVKDRSASKSPMHVLYTERKSDLSLRWRRCDFELDLNFSFDQQSQLLARVRGWVVRE
jgi:hypothetical protein